MKQLILLLIMTVVFFISGCNQAVINEVESNNQDLAIEEDVEEEVEEVVEEEVEEVVEEIEEEIDEEIVEEKVEEELKEEITAETYALHNVNELGQIMVIMYHNLSDKAGAYATTKEIFINDLTRLYESGYVTISMSDLISNTIDVPMGKTPVVLTFDDGSKSNFFYDEDGVSPDSVVGILDEFAKTHEGFGKNAIFYLYGLNPFRERDLLKEKLVYLVEEGYEIGSHTFTHDKLTELNAVGIQSTMALNQDFISGYIDYELIHLSIPYGIRPRQDLKEYMFKGTYDDITYEHVSAVNVGWNPIYSPSHIKFDPYSINRVTCGDDEAELHFWLDYFDEKPEKRYYSDGDPDRIVIPESYKEYLKEALEKEIIIYGEE